MRRPRSSLVGIALAWTACGKPRVAPTVAQVCPTDRVVVLAGQDDIARFAGCKRAIGIRLRTGLALDTKPLAALEEITGDLDVGPSLGLDELSLVGLKTVGGTLKIASNSSISGVFLPKLERAGGIHVDGNTTLATLSMPRLQRVLGALTITDCATLGMVEASALISVGKELAIAGNPELTLLELGAFERAGSVRIEGCPKLDPARVAELHTKLATP